MVLLLLVFAKQLAVYAKDPIKTGFVLQDF